MKAFENTLLMIGFAGRRLDGCVDAAGQKQSIAKVADPASITGVLEVSSGLRYGADPADAVNGTENGRCWEAGCGLTNRPRIAGFGFSI